MVDSNESERKFVKQSNSGEALGRKVRIAAHKDEAARKARQDAEFYDLYNRVRDAPFPDAPNYTRHVNVFDLTVLHFDDYPFSQSALAIYPVIASRADYYKNDWFQLSLESIGQLAGLNRKTVRDAIDEILYMNKGVDDEDRGSVPFLQRSWKIKGARQFWLYRVGIARPELRQPFQGQYFPFHTAIINTGLWKRLRPRAKTLYLALRSEARLDPELHDAIEGTEIMRDAGGFRDGLYPELYASRRFEVYRGTIAHVCRLAGISASHADKPLDELQRAGLVVREATWTYDSMFRVYLLPAHWNRD